MPERHEEKPVSEWLRYAALESAPPAEARRRALAAYAGWRGRRRAWRGLGVAALVIVSGGVAWWQLRPRPIPVVSKEDSIVRTRSLTPFVFSVVLAAQPLPQATSPGAATPPIPTYEQQPELTPAALAKGFTGAASFEITIDASGRVSAAKETGPALGLGLDERAENAVEQWRFQPATRGGAAVAATIPVAVTFRLPDAGMDAGMVKPVPSATSIAPGQQVTPPVPIYQPDPVYSDAARHAKFQGSENLDITIGADGHVSNPVVLNPLGMGLDTQAVKAVLQWRFQPSTYQGKPIAVRATVQINFHLY